LSTFSPALRKFQHFDAPLDLYVASLRINEPSLDIYATSFDVDRPPFDLYAASLEMDDPVV